jgi:hypothetical protein
MTVLARGGSHFLRSFLGARAFMMLPLLSVEEAAEGEEYVEPAGVVAALRRRSCCCCGEEEEESMLLLVLWLRLMQLS